MRRPLLRAEILSVGTELTTGTTRDTNAGDIAGDLFDAGVRVGRLVDLPDKLDVVTEALAAALERSDPRFPGKDPRYASLKPHELPLTEALKDTVARFLPYWHDTIAPAVKRGERVLVAAHGNSMRALIKYLDDVSESDIVGLNIPTGIPLVYELNEQLRPERHYYLANEAEVRAAVQAVAAQGKAAK